MKSKAATVFTDVADTIDDHVFGITSSDEVIKEYGVEDGQIVLFKKVIARLRRSPPIIPPTKVR